MNDIYKFQAQRKVGDAGEAKLDDYFSANGFEIRHVEMSEQRRGIDRVLIDKKTGKETTVEYKCDTRTQKTGNVFVETISNSKTGALGWALKSQADYIAYYMTGIEEVLIIKTTKFREHIARWVFEYKARPVANHGYFTFGICVPADEVKKVADKVIKL